MNRLESIAINKFGPGVQRNDIMRNDGVTTRRLIVPTRLVGQPRRVFVEWHRENCFKK